MSKKQSQSNSKKHLFYGKDVLIQVVSLATNETSGVLGITSKNLRIVVDGDVLRISIDLPLIFGFEATEVAYRVQENIKSNIETMTDYKVGRMDINIISVTAQD